ncbi:hypothetical protein [Sediminibacterium sp.]|uniref:hypothetical protein n=1 Tax=Sediminibacterium sp. TaxID=1917865 RepID=UPI00273738D0|nr:hypothetical protein [Sediminibacterium sp.]MDP3394079.1 hypothetical protein [Sediminibacterium sp.]MDP3566332.1 hypothetical protein [Sediminibacterium sp.]
MNQEQVLEKQDQLKATIITLVITVILFSIFFYVRYQQPFLQEPAGGEGIEVNLGDAETGYGTTPPTSIGETAQEQNNTNNSPSEETVSIPENNPTEEDVPLNKPAVNTTSKPTNANSIVPPNPKPKAVFTGNNSKGSGGNLADSYNGVTNQGIAGGKGDQGKPTGNINSDSYQGNASSGNGGLGGTGGVAIKSGLGGRKITKLPSFEDDFNENAKVAVDITVNKSGAVLEAVINLKATTTTNQRIRNIAIQKAKTLQLSEGNANEQTGTLVFNFKLRN